MVDENEVQCPFDHDLEPPEVKNDLIGVGGKLARKMKSATGTYLYDKYKEETDKVENPKDISGHPFNRNNKDKPVKITVAAGDDVIVHEYPVSCAAHHCIPAQESLKESPLLTFMVKKGSSEPVKDGSYSTGSVWANVGYDVNGAQNGIFLPGSYAVGGGRGGMGVWSSHEDGDDEGVEDPSEAIPDPHSNLLDGAAGEISALNRKWLYVNQAVRLCPGQFHDRHVDYSQFVQSVLKKIFQNYKTLYREMVLESKCSKCKDKAAKAKEIGIPTPFGLVARLNKVSDKFKACLNGTTWRPNIYTSKWGQAYMVAVRAKNSAVTAGLT